MDDKQLVKECLRGNEEAQWLLYNQFAGVMLGVCYRYTKSITDAEDILQDGFVKVFNNLSAYRNEGELGAWIRKIMVNTALNFLKKDKRYQADLVFNEDYLHPVDNQDTAILLEAKQIAILIRQLPA
jgi:RNA polymerase sigma-70 factor (ECF subfamily)